MYDRTSHVRRERRLLLRDIFYVAMLLAAMLLLLAYSSLFAETREHAGKMRTGTESLADVHKGLPQLSSSGSRPPR